MQNGIVIDGVQYEVVKDDYIDSTCDSCDLFSLCSSMHNERCIAYRIALESEIFNSSNNYHFKRKEVSGEK